MILDTHTNPDDDAISTDSRVVYHTGYTPTDTREKDNTPVIVLSSNPKTRVPVFKKKTEEVVRKEKEEKERRLIAAKLLAARSVSEKKKEERHEQNRARAQAALINGYQAGRGKGQNTERDIRVRRAC